jgi:hypothetical protein
MAIGDIFFRKIANSDRLLVRIQSDWNCQRALSCCFHKKLKQPSGQADVASGAGHIGASRTLCHSRLTLFTAINRHDGTS